MQPVNRPAIDSSPDIVRGFVVALLLVALLAIPAPGQEQTAEITAGSASLYQNNRVVGSVPQGARFRVEATQGNWLRVRATVSGRTRDVWVRQADVRLLADQKAAGKAPAASPSRMIRVTAAKADVTQSSKVVGTVYRGEIFPLGKTQGRYYSIPVEINGRRDEGWVQDTNVEVIAAAIVGPSLGNHVPRSVTTAKAVVDWSTEKVVLQLPVPPRTPQAPLRLIHSGESAPNVDIVRSNGAATLGISGDRALDLATSGTRSLWIREGDEQTGVIHRVDLPAPSLQTTVTVQRSAEIKDELVLMIPASGLLPGFCVEYAYAGGDLAAISFQPLSRLPGSLPRLGTVYQNKSVDQVRVVIPLANQATREQNVALRVRNPDGSLSETLGLRARGDVWEKTARRALDVKPALVDTAVTMPNVQLQIGKEARAALLERGLSTVFVDGVWSPLSPNSANELLVSGQGVAAGAPVLYGQTVVLSVASDNTWQSASTDSASANVDPPLDVADDLGFADVVPSSVSGGGGGTNGAQGSSIPLDDSGIAAALSKVDGDLLNEQLQVTAIPVDNDPGVVLDPRAELERLQPPAILKLLLRGLLAQPTWQDLPGPIGASISLSIEQHEEALVAGAAEKPNPAVLGALAQTVLSTLKLTASEQQQEALVKDLEQFASRRRSVDRLDRNSNGKLADDLAIRTVIWLFENGLFDPAANVIVVTTADGSTAAVTTDEPHATDWLKLIPWQLILPGVPAKPTSPATGATSSTASSTGGRPRIPDGPAVVTMKDGPDKVRVPQVRDQTLQVAGSLLSSLGLKIAGAAEFFQTDRVTAVDPDSGSWVPSGSEVNLSATRRVPTVVKMSKEQAEAELTRYKLQAEVKGQSQAEDVVVRQEPAAGEYVEVGSKIALDVAAIVPAVVGDLQRDAVAELREKGLEWRAATKAFGTDKVVGQEPPPGVLLDHQSKVLLDLHVAVPNLVGRSLDRARTTLAEWDLAAEVAARRAREGDIVRGQRPGLGTYVPHGSTVTLGPVPGVVPDVRGRSIGRAQSQLENEEDYPTRNIGNLQDDDIVTAQSPVAGSELERGNTVTLDARLQLPDVRGHPLVRARETLESLVGRLHVEIAGESARTDVVYSQDPSGGQLVFPRTSVYLVPGVSVPNVRGDPVRQAGRQLEDRGLGWRVVASGTRETRDRSLFDAVVVDNQRPQAGLYRRGDVGIVQLWTVQYVPMMRTVPLLVHARQGVTAEQAFAAVSRAELTPIAVFNGQRLDQAGFAVVAIAYAATNRGANLYQLARVVSQDPQAGTRLIAGSPVFFQLRVNLENLDAK